MKSRRQAAILEIVDREAVANQEQLRRWLRARGFDATQATISRDIKELGLVKRATDGAYQRAESVPASPANAALTLQRAVAEYLRRIDRVQQIVVIRTGVGQAQPLALALDGAQLPEVVGTLGGDDTIFVIARDERHGAALVKRLEEYAGR